MAHLIIVDLPIKNGDFPSIFVCLTTSDDENPGLILT